MQQRSGPLCPIRPSSLFKITFKVPTYITLKGNQALTAFFVVYVACSLMCLTIGPLQPLVPGLCHLVMSEMAEMKVYSDNLV